LGLVTTGGPTEETGRTVRVLIRRRGEAVGAGQGIEASPGVALSRGLGRLVAVLVGPAHLVGLGPHRRGRHRLAGARWIVVAVGFGGPRRSDAHVDQTQGDELIDGPHGG
jgi:hypothetical protein